MTTPTQKHLDMANKIVECYAADESYHRLDGIKKLKYIIIAALAEAEGTSPSGAFEAAEKYYQDFLKNNPVFENSRTRFMKEDFLAGFKAGAKDFGRASQAVELPSDWESKAAWMKEYTYPGSYEDSDWKKCLNWLRSKVRVAKPQPDVSELLSAIEFAELRFSAMSESTTENGLPSQSELIGLCNESALKLGLVLRAWKEKQGV